VSKKKRAATEPQAVAPSTGGSEATAAEPSVPASSASEPVSPAEPRDEHHRTLDRRIGWALFLGATVLLLVTEKPAGFVRDESQYFHAGESYARWFQSFVSSPAQALKDENIAAAFSANREHPALMKNLYGLSFVLLHEKLGLLRPAAAFRFPAFVFAALILPLIFSLGRRLFGRGPALFAALSFFLVPRQFFEAHLACFDVPMATTWLLVVFCFVEALERPRWWLWTGIAFGLAMATKHNAYFIPLTLIPFSLWRGWEHSKARPEARRLFLAINGAFVAMAALYALMALTLGPRMLSTFDVISPQLGLFVLTAAGGTYLCWKLSRVDAPTFRAVAPLVSMAVLGPVVFYLHWPYLWHHPVERYSWYLSFHLNHEHYAWFYLGELLRQPPFPLGYVLVKTALTVPTSLFVPMVAGVAWVLVRTVRGQVTALEWVVLANAAMSVLVLSQPSVPHFGGVKHWFPSMPFLALLAAGVVLRGAEGLSTWLSSRVPALTEKTAFIALCALVSLPALLQSVRVYPYGTSAYSELAGGLPGAATLGMQRQFWANNVTGVLDWVNANARPGERIYFHEVHGGMIQDMQRNGMLRRDIQPIVDGMGCFMGTCPALADMVVYQYHQEFRETEFRTWEAFGTQKPVTGLYVDETPQVVVYRRR
jgi:4-amino-4-deoxy-L-arabinose transferase-like glycosyltransferase